MEGGGGSEGEEEYEKKEREKEGGVTILGRRKEGMLWKWGQ